MRSANRGVYGKRSAAGSAASGQAPASRWRSSRRAAGATLCRATSNLAVIPIRAVVAGFRLLHAVREHGDRQSDLDDALEQLRESEADQQSHHGAAGDELRRVLGCDRFEVALLAQAAVQLIDAVADAVARGDDGVIELLLFVVHLLAPRLREIGLDRFDIRFDALDRFRRYELHRRELLLPHHR